MSTTQRMAISLEVIAALVPIRTSEETQHNIYRMMYDLYRTFLENNRHYTYDYWDTSVRCAAVAYELGWYEAASEVLNPFYRDLKHVPEHLKAQADILKARLQQPLPERIEFVTNPIELEYQELCDSIAKLSVKEVATGLTVEEEQTLSTLLEKLSLNEMQIALNKLEVKP